MARPMAERLAQAVLHEDVARGRIDDAWAYTRPDRRDRCLMRPCHGLVNLPERLGRRSELNRARKIHAVSVVDAPKVQHGRVTGVQSPFRRSGMREGTVRARRHDRVERRSGKSRATNRRVELGGNLVLPPAHRHEIAQATGDPGDTAPPFADRLDFRHVLDHACALDDPVRGDQYRSRTVCAQRRRRAAGEIARHRVEAAHRQPRRFDPDALARFPPQQIDDGCVVGVGHRLDDNRAGLERRDERLRGRHIAEIHHEDACVRKEHHGSRGAGEPGEISNVWKMRHDEGIERRRVHVRAHALDTRKDGHARQRERRTAPRADWIATRNISRRAIAGSGVDAVTGGAITGAASTGTGSRTGTCSGAFGGSTQSARPKSEPGFCPFDRLSAGPFDEFRAGPFDGLRAGPFDRLAAGPFERLSAGAFDELGGAALDTLTAGAFKTLRAALDRLGPADTPMAGATAVAVAAAIGPADTAGESPASGAAMTGADSGRLRCRSWISARPRIAARFSGALLRTTSSSLRASSYCAVSISARPSVTRAERYEGCRWRPMRQVSIASA